MARRICPRCFEFVNKKEDVCPNCGYEIEKSNSKTDIVSAATNNDENELVVAENFGAENIAEQASPKKRHAHKKKNNEVINAKPDENGELDINTTDVTYFEGAKEEYSAKKSVEGNPDKILWWEIYKWADLYLARRKINKEVNKAAIIKPTYISHTKMWLLCLFFGLFGAHDFYAKNIKRGIVAIVSMVISITVISIPAFVGVIDVSIGGGFGFLALSMWIWDFVAILRHKYKYRESKLIFISKLNLKTRKKLGKKYVNINDWFTPYEKKLSKTNKIRQSKI